MRILTIGCVTTDLLVRVDRFARADEEMRAMAADTYDGGSAANVAVAIRRLGHASAFLGCIGDDPEGMRHRNVLEREGVDITRVITSRRGLRTTLVVGIVQSSGDRQLYFHGGAAEELAPSDITLESLDRIDCVHLCTLGPELVERILELRRRCGNRIMLSIDPGCVGLEGPRAARVRAILPDTDLLFVNDVEFSQVFGDLEPTDLPDIAASELPQRVAIKLGDRGAFLFSREDGLTHCPAFSVDAIDSTGAGDAFAGGYLAGLAAGLPPAQLGRFASAVAAMETRYVGCREGLPTLDAVTLFLRAAVARDAAATAGLQASPRASVPPERLV